MGYSIYKVGVVGGGTMGGGIAALVARQGVPVIVKEANEEFAARTKDRIKKQFCGWYEKGKISESRLLDLENSVDVTPNSADLANVNLLIEAIPENLDAKLKIFREFDALLPEEVIMVSNTSSLPVTKLGRATRRAPRVAGMHFFNPPTRMALVELVRGGDTSQETIEAINRFATATLEKTTITVADRPGFLVNCLLLPYLNEAALSLEECEISPEEVDAEARSYGWKMGPFTLLDTVGIDVALSVGDFLARVYPGRVKKGSVFEKMIAAGCLGEKNGSGFLIRGDREPIEVALRSFYPYRPASLSPKDVFDRMMAAFLNEAARAIEEKVASENDVEVGSEWGLSCPRGGPLHIIDEMGAGELVAGLESLRDRYGPRFEPCALLRSMAMGKVRFFETW